MQIKIIITNANNNDNENKINGNGDNIETTTLATKKTDKTNSVIPK